MLISEYQDKVSRILPLFCKYAESSDGKELPVDMDLYKYHTPVEVDETIEVMQNLWLDSRNTKKKSTKN